MVYHRFSAVPCQRHGRGWGLGISDGLVILRRIGTGLMAIGSRLSPARDRAEGGLGILMALLSSEEYWFTHRFSAVPSQRQGRGWTWDLDGLVILRRIMVYHRFSAVPSQRHGRGWTWDLDGLVILRRIMVYHRFSAVPSQRHGRGWTWDLDGLAILRRILVYHRFSAVPCQREGGGWSWDLDGLGYPPQEYWFTIGSRLSPARDRAEGGLGILMALSSSEE